MGKHCWCGSATPGISNHGTKPFHLDFSLPLPQTDTVKSSEWSSIFFIFNFLPFYLTRKLPANKTIFFPHTRISFWSRRKYNLSPRKHIFTKTPILSANTSYILFSSPQFWGWDSPKTSLEREEGTLLTLLFN